jgi:hypothetical protein
MPDVRDQIDELLRRQALAQVAAILRDAETTAGHEVRP